MLTAKDCAHLNADDWAGIAAKILKLKKDEKLLVSISDEHMGGVTSCMPDVKPVIDGFAKHSQIMLLNGDDFEYESPIAFIQKMPELKERFGHLGAAAYREALVTEAEAVLHQKVAEDIETLRALITENTGRKIMKVIGNHENFETFRNALTDLAAQYPNFQWTPEVAIISMPGGSKETRDRLLATHGDLQMDDLWFVEDGGTDKERKCYNHREMAEKVVNIATKSWAPSAEKQEKGQGIVNWWRKPNATAKTLYAELLFRAQEGDFHHAIRKTELDRDSLSTTEIKLQKRKKKFESFQEELDGREGMDESQKKEEALVYQRAIEKIDGQLEVIEKRLKALDNRSTVLFPHAIKPLHTVLHYTKPGENEPHLFTSKSLARVSHVNYGHTHVSAEGVEINGLDNKKIIVSNNASVTGAVIKKKLDDKGKPLTSVGAYDDLADLGNLGVLLYRVKDGKITEITSMGRLITENLHAIKHLISDIPKPPKEKKPSTDDALPHVAAITPESIIRKKEGQSEDGHDTPP